MKALGLVLLVAGGAAEAADFAFCWTGAEGYTMTGRMQIPDARLSADVVTEDDVTAFAITGYRDGRKLGTWNLRQLDDQTTWHLRFDPERLVFPTGGDFRSLRSQGWNANGAVRDCGNPGFGFNSGNYAQDVCVDGAYMQDSSIAPDTPFPAVRGTAIPACAPADLFSKRGIKD